MHPWQQHYKALGSEILITLVGETTACDRIGEAVHDMIGAFESRFSRFLSSSELSDINGRPGQRITVSNPMRDILMVCRDMMHHTDGLYNPFILPALQRAGYQGSWPHPDKLHGAPDFRERTNVLPQTLELRGNQLQMPTDTALDFGGIGKGYLLDLLAAYLADQSMAGFWISLGGDIVCAGHDHEGADWRIHVQAADRSATPLTVIQAGSPPLFIATSGVTKRRGGDGASSWHHIIDPRTGKPARTSVTTATVTAHSGAAADVYAKCLVIDPRQAPVLLDSGAIQGYVLQFTDKEPVIQL